MKSLNPPPFSYPIDFSRKITALTEGSFVFTPTPEKQITFPMQSRKILKLRPSLVSVAIPNMFKTTNLTTNLIWLTRDGWSTYNTLEIRCGYYTVAQLQSAIVAGIQMFSDASDWFTDFTDPAILIQDASNESRIQITLNNNKMTHADTGSFGIDLSCNSTSKLCDVLGYSTTTRFTVSGTTSSTFVSDINTRLNWFGDIMYVLLSNAGVNTFINGSTSQILTCLSQSKTTGMVTYSFGGNVEEYWELSSRTIEDLTITFADISGNHIYFFDGDIAVNMYIEIYD